LFNRPLDSIRQTARKEAENWGWAAATAQLQSYYDHVVQLSRAQVGSLARTE
jgi:hypothetical protein